jgi:hypothetical protein
VVDICPAPWKICGAILCRSGAVRPRLASVRQYRPGRVRILLP